MNVRNLLELQRSFESDRAMQPAAEKQEVGRRVKFAGELFELRLEREDLAGLPRELRERPALRLGQALCETARLAQLRRDQKENGELGREGLCRGDPDLGAGMRE